MSGSVVDVRGLEVTLAATGARVVHDVSYEIEPGQVMGLVGESGSGKTTAGLTLLRHCRRGAVISGGEIRVDGRDVMALTPAELQTFRGATVAYIAQDPTATVNPALRMGLQLREILAVHRPSWSAEQQRERVLEVLEEVALTPKVLQRYAHQLSGGQLQRVVIAMAFVCRPKVIVCDEPTTGLDVATQTTVIETIRGLCRKHGAAALYVSHDVAAVAGLADRMSVMYAGEIVEQGSRGTVFSAPSHPYTRALLDAVPRMGARQRLVGIAGQPPALTAMPVSSCTFAPRCAHALDVCRAERPGPVALGDGHVAACFRAEERREPARPRAMRPAPDAPADDEQLLTVSIDQARYGDAAVLHDVELALGAGKILAIVGESGSGKTTLARCIAGLHAAFDGEVRLRDQPLAHSAARRDAASRKAVQYVFQSPFASLNPRRMVRDSVGMPLRVFFGARGERLDSRVAALLDRVALRPELAYRYPDELSGGERQRVAIARALATEPAVLVCDEITSALDVSVQASIVELLAELRAEMGLGVVFVTHDLALTGTIADAVLVLKDGRVTARGETTELFQHASDPYTAQLLAAAGALERTMAGDGDPSQSPAVGLHRS